ncbi:SPOR domain-containing protein [Hymenobacter ruricola]|uniref:SPOR domain-containing protein n=1 Tax=Hymenobacter ruricola TaxID=2791023 RepID=A0ABS0HZ22_9BACT|nr:SPOR domain-containing protein [Hymenobacter ruricola]MBF9219935.1 SPOR domain-containing protein [Hymenobacter ruricola]
MTTAELERRLLAEGCNPDNYALNTRSYDGFCLMRQEAQWNVFYSERGHDQPPIFTSPDEDAACRFFFDFVMKMEHRHLIAMLRSEPAAQALRARLEAQGIATHAYRLHYAQNDYRQVVSVVGKDIFRVRALLGKVPVEDADEARPGFWERLRHIWG